MANITWSSGNMNLKLTQVDEKVYKFSVRKDWRLTTRSTIFSADSFEEAVERVNEAVFQINRQTARFEKRGFTDNDFVP